MYINYVIIYVICRVLLLYKFSISEFIYLSGYNDAILEVISDPQSPP